MACRHRGTVANVQQALQREALPRWEAPPMTISLHLPDIACMHSNRFAEVAAAAAIGTLLVVGCGPASRQASVPAAAGLLRLALACFK